MNRNIKRPTCGMTETKDDLVTTGNEVKPFVYVVTSYNIHNLYNEIYEIFAVYENEQEAIDVCRDLTDSWFEFRYEKKEVK